MPTGGTRVGQVAPEELGCPNAENRSRSLIHSVPLPSVGIAGAVAFEMSYLIDILLFR